MTAGRRRGGPGWPNQRGGSRRAWLGLAAALLIAVALGLARWQHAQAQARQQRGQALFRGEQALQGRLAGHAQALPTLASRCSNCHEARDVAPALAVPVRPDTARPPAVGPGDGDAAASSPATYAMPLDRAGLAVRKPRRGGPPSVYDAEALCTLLRTGVDPAHVIIAGVMPRYSLSDDQCADLWAELTSR